MRKSTRYLAGILAGILLPLAAVAGQVNVNTADAETISAELQGVGLTKAKAIVDYREQHGPFKTAADLAEVKGIGARTIELNKDNIVVQKPRDSSK